MTRSLTSIEDEALVLAAQAGDDAAFHMILRRWLPIMRRHATRLLGDPAAAEDVCQDACVGLVRALSGLRDPARAHGWMLRIVTNKAADWVRRRRRERRLVHSIGISEPRAATSDLQESGDSERRKALLRAACAGLPLDLRAIVSLYYGEELSIAVIAEVFGIPSGTVKSRLHEARAQLRALLERTLDEQL